MKTETDRLVNNYVKQVKKHLPDWIKNNNEKLEDIILEINSHIWDSAQEIANSKDPEPKFVQEAINRLGSPKEMARSYKKRGTPKYFISEELSSIYTNVNWIVGIIVFLVIATVQVVVIEPDNLGQALINGISLSFPTIMTFLMVITWIFVGLSHEGYFPENLDTDKKADKEKDPKSKFYKPDEFLFNGLVGSLFGLLIIIIPIDMINLFRIIVNFILDLLGRNTVAMRSEVVGLSVELQTWFMIIGILAIIAGIVNLAKIGTSDPSYQFKMNLILIFTGIADLVVAAYILANLHLLAEVIPLSDNVLLILALLGVIGSLIDLATKVYKNTQLYGLIEDESFPTT
ncbi:MAG: HAAS signaling domain-containing protein [Candidatus Hodarchaeales archaeon]|jgi:hypothetical protein